MGWNQPPAEISRAQKHCHLLTRPGAPAGPGRAAGHRLQREQDAGIITFTGCGLCPRQADVPIRDSCGRARCLAPMCSTSARGRGDGGRALSLVLQVLSLLTIQEMVEGSVLIPKELMNLHPSLQSVGQHPAQQPRADREGKSG